MIIIVAIALYFSISLSESWIIGPSIELESGTFLLSSGSGNSVKSNTKDGIVDPYCTRSLYTHVMWAILLYTCQHTTYKSDKTSILQVGHTIQDNYWGA